MIIIVTKKKTFLMQPYMGIILFQQIFFQKSEYFSVFWSDDATTDF